jgi:hypothetical protein
MMQGDVAGSLEEFDRALRLDSSIRPCEHAICTFSMYLESNQSFVPLQLIYFLVSSGRRSGCPVMSRYQMPDSSREQLSIQKNDTTLQSLTMSFTSNDFELDLT